MKSWRVTKNLKRPKQDINTFYTTRVNDFEETTTKGVTKIPPTLNKLEIYPLSQKEDLGGLQATGERV
jgi:hypothetical protein